MERDANSGRRMEDNLRKRRRRGGKEGITKCVEEEKSEMMNDRHRRREIERKREREGMTE